VSPGLYAPFTAILILHYWLKTKRQKPKKKNKNKKTKQKTMKLRPKSNKVAAYQVQ